MSPSPLRSDAGRDRPPTEPLPVVAPPPSDDPPPANVQRGELRLGMLGWTAWVLLWEGLVLAAPGDWSWRQALPGLDQPSGWIVGGLLLLFIAARRNPTALNRWLDTGLLAISLACLASLGLAGLGLGVRIAALLATAVALAVAIAARLIRWRVWLLWPLAAGGYLALALLWVDNIYFRFGRGHINLVHLWLITFRPVEMLELGGVPSSLVREFALVGFLYLLLSLAMPASIRPAPRPSPGAEPDAGSRPANRRRGPIALGGAALTLLIWWHWFPTVAWREQLAQYLDLRLSLLVPLPDAPPFRTPAMQEVSRSRVPFDQESAHREGAFTWLPDTGGEAGRAVATGGPNLVIIYAESLRADMFAAVMPRMAGRARQHLWLRRHQSASNGTVTSLMAVHHGFLPVRWQALVAARRRCAWHELLRRVGYRLIWIDAIDEPARLTVKADFEVESIPRREDRWSSTAQALERAAERLAPASGVAGDLPVGGADFGGSPPTPAAATPTATMAATATGSRSAAGQLAAPRHAPRTAPEFLVVYLYNTHFNYSYPPHAERFLPTIPEEFSIFQLQPGPEILTGLGNRYRNAAAWLDELLDRFFDRMEAAGRFDDTIFVVTSDHGESLGEGNYLAHCTGPVPEQYRVPAVIFGAGVPRLTIDGPTDHLDLLPTLAPLLGFRVEGLPGIDAVRQTKTTLVQLDDSASGRLLVRGPAEMSIFDLTGSDLRWRLTTTADFMVDARPTGPYADVNNADLAARVRTDLGTAWERLRQPGSPYQR